jgi:hypothetical protein
MLDDETAFDFSQATAGLRILLSWRCKHELDILEAANLGPADLDEGSRLRRKYELELNANRLTKYLAELEARCGLHASEHDSMVADIMSCDTERIEEASKTREMGLYELAWATVTAGLLHLEAGAQMPTPLASRVSAEAHVLIAHGSAHQAVLGALLASIETYDAHAPQLLPIRLLEEEHRSEEDMRHCEEKRRSFEARFGNNDDLPF